MDAIRYERDNTIIAKRKLRFYKQLTESELTNSILGHRWDTMKDNGEISFTRSIVHEVKQILSDESIEKIGDKPMTTEESLTKQNILQRIKQKLINIKEFIVDNDKDGLTESVRCLLMSNGPENKNR